MSFSIRFLVLLLVALVSRFERASSFRAPTLAVVPKAQVAPPLPRSPSIHRPAGSSQLKMSTWDNNQNQDKQAIDHHFPHQAEEMSLPVIAAILALLMGPLILMLAFPQPALALSMSTTAPIWSNAHVVSTLGIAGCLVTKRLLVSADLSVQEESKMVQLDALYGLMVLLLIVSGIQLAGQDLNLLQHQSLFWVKLSLAGIWGGLAVFPSLIFGQRQRERWVPTRNHSSVGPAPISKALEERLHSVLEAELLMIFSMAVVSSWMAQGVGYVPDSSWQVGAAGALLATCGSFSYFANQAMAWKDKEEETKFRAEHAVDDQEDGKVEKHRPFSFLL